MQSGALAVSADAVMQRCYERNGQCRSVVSDPRGCMQAIAHLLLAGNSITSSGATALCAGAAQNTSLASMHLDHNDLREAGLRAVLHCLEKNAGMAYMRVDNTNSPEALRIAIEMLLEQRRES
jgi:hypothetical protein